MLMTAPYTVNFPKRWTPENASFALAVNELIKETFKLCNNLLKLYSSESGIPIASYDRRFAHLMQLSIQAINKQKKKKKREKRI